jgi:uncharacterized protein YoxC
MQLEILALVVVIMLVVVVAFLVQLLIQARTTMQGVDEFVRETRRDLLPLLQELRETSQHLNRAAARIEEGSGRVGDLLESLGEVGDTIHSVNSLVQGGVGRYLGNLAGLWSGFRAASKAIRTQMSKNK